MRSTGGRVLDRRSRAWTDGPCGTFASMDVADGRGYWVREMLCAGINWGYMPASVRGLVHRSCFVCEKGRTFFLLVLVVFAFLMVVPFPPVRLCASSRLASVASPYRLFGQALDVDELLCSSKTSELHGHVIDRDIPCLLLQNRTSIDLQDGLLHYIYQLFTTCIESSRRLRYTFSIFLVDVRLASQRIQHFPIWKI